MLTLIRHGESTGNVKKLFVGQQDYPLTEVGVEQAQMAGATLANERFDYAFCSSLLRAKATLQHIHSANNLSTPFDTVVTDVLKERSAGTYEGLKYMDVKKILAPKKYKVWQRDYFEAPEAGESMSDVADRVLPYCKQTVFKLSDMGYHVLVVAHYTVLKVMLGHIRQMDEHLIPGLEIEHAVPYVYQGRILT